MCKDTLTGTERFNDLKSRKTGISVKTCSLKGNLNTVDAMQLQKFYRMDRNNLMCLKILCAENTEGIGME